MKQFDTAGYLQDLTEQLLTNCPRHAIELTRTWASNFPSTPGVYVFWDKKTVIYVGETGNLKGRMKDMIDTRNHTLRRSLGKKLFSSSKGLQPATARLKFIDTIEDMLNTHIKQNLTVCCLPVSLGRKELEEKIQIEKKPEYNQKGLRRTF
jgi:hypothetical protein